MRASTPFTPPTRPPSDPRSPHAQVRRAGDPDTVQAVEASSDASSHSLAVKVLQGGAAIVAVLLLLVGIGQLFTEMRSFLLALLLWAAAFSLLLLIQKV